MALVTTTTAPIAAHNDSALARGIRTFLQSIIGLIVAVLTVPGVQAIVTQNLLTALGSVIAPSVLIGLVSFLWNILRKDVPNV